MTTTATPIRAIAYRRVSTAQQAKSGLGLGAQQAAIDAWAKAAGAQIVGSFSDEGVSGRAARPGLQAAIQAAKALNAVLVVKTLDRLGRKAGDLLALLDGGVEIVAIDTPQANGPTGKFLLQSLSLIAELEAAMISERTRAALAAAKARGTVLGKPSNLTDQHRRAASPKGLSAIQAKADQRAAYLGAVIDGIEAETGITSGRGLANILNARGIPSPRGGRWTHTAVRRCRERAAAA